MPTDGGFPFPTSTPTPRKCCFGRRFFDFYNNTTFFPTNASKFSVRWRRSGFSIDNDVYLYPSDTQALETLSRTIVRCPVSLQRLHYDKKSNYVLYQPKSRNRKAELLDPLDFLARVLIHIPQPRQHSILYYGHYARRTRKHSANKRTTDDDNELNTAHRKSLRRRWANLIRRVFKTDPLICKKCGGKMHVVSFITDPGAIRAILEHRDKTAAEPRAPPAQSSL